MTGESLPDILVLSSLNPVEHEGVLYSPKLSAFVSEYARAEGNMWGAFLEAEAGGLDELSEARRLADYYQLKTAEKLQNYPRDELLWTQRFNQAGEEIYGQPDSAEVKLIAAQELKELEKDDPHSLAAFIYRKIAGKVAANTESLPVVEADVLADLRVAVFARFAPMLELIGGLPEGPYSPAEVRGVFEKILQCLAQEDSSWNDWQVTNPENKTMLSVMASKKEIEVPDAREPVKSKSQLMGLALHEIGVHAQRAVNGNKSNDGLMTKGLPGYLDFEEGLGVAFEYLITGKVPEKVRDRYVDVALAAGVINGFILSREQLIELGISREEARTSGPIDRLKMEKSVIDHVNRIFRGGSGQPVRNEHGSIVDQPVFGKDLVYYEGFVKARDFVLEQQKAGTPPDSILEFLLSGKFDATNPKHILYLKEKHSVSLQDLAQQG